MQLNINSREIWALPFINFYHVIFLQHYEISQPEILGKHMKKMPAQGLQI